MEAANGAIEVVIVTGPVGAGKSTVADVMRWTLVDQGVTCAVIDMDALRMVAPYPPGDPFGERIGHRNLASIWPNLVDAGVRAVMIATVVEDRAHSLAAHRAAMPGGKVTIVRLNVPMDLVKERLAHRERTPDDLAWSLNRAPELQGIMERGAVEDLLVEVGERTPEEVAEEIIARLGLAPERRETVS
jgi:adenylylsulfate kinase-like enzyme